MVNYYIKYLKYKTKYLNLKGGKYLSEGEDGIVFHPPLLCIDREEKYETVEYVGKILDEDKATDEFKKSNKIKELDPEGKWSVTIDKICKINEIQIDEDYLEKKNKSIYKGKNTQLISKYGGVSLAKGLIKFDEEYPALFESTNVPLFFKLIKTQLIPIVNKLNDTYAHNDLHYNNILYDSTTGKIKLFDFGKLIPIAEKKGYRSNSDFEDFHYFLDQIIRCIIARNWFQPEMRIYMDKRNTILINPNANGEYTREQYVETLLALPDLPLP